MGITFSILPTSVFKITESFVAFFDMILTAYFKLFQNWDCLPSKKLSSAYFLFGYV